MYAYIPDSLFGTSPSDYIYLYSKFGVNNNSDDGREKWLTSSAPIPATVWMFGAGLVGLFGIRRKLASHQVS